MTENEKQEAFDKWYDENYDEWAEGEEGIALREELEQAFKSGIAELEKENAELKQAEKDKVVEHFEAYGQCRDSRRIAELEAENERLTVSYETLKLHDEEEIEMLKSENAELKADNAFYEKACEGATMMYEHLTKAKELLKRWVELYKPKLEGYPITPIQVETEQFLSEVKK